LLAIKLAVFLFAVSLLGTSSAHALPLGDPFAGPSLWDLWPITVIDIPGVGPVDMTGKYVGPGTTSAVIYREADLPLPNVGDSGTVPIKMLDLSLKSTHPVSLGASFFDVFVELDPAALDLNVGAMTITRTSNDGGTFDASVDVHGKVTATEVGNPSNMQVFSFFDVFVTLDAPWSFTPSPGSADNALYPLSGFFAGVIPESGGQVASIVFSGTQTASQLTFQPALIPEPGTLGLIGLGFGVMGWGRKHRVRCDVPFVANSE
jgi:hypothetical protein